jgi:transcriptional regulator with XRE-family HTH domain
MGYLHNYIFIQFNKYDNRTQDISFVKAIRRLELTQAEAAERMGITQPKVSALLRGDFANLSERKLMDCLNRIGYDIEIRVKPVTRRVGRLTLAFA